MATNSGSMEGGFYIGQVSGSHFLLRGPRLSLTQKQSKQACWNLGGYRDGLMVSSSVLDLDPTTELPYPVTSRRNPSIDTSAQQKFALHSFRAEPPSSHLP